jgi:quinol monooxygenase YgiN
MIEFHMQLNIREAKGPEIRQTLKSLGRTIRAQTGCKRCSFYVRAGDCTGMMIQIWDGKAALNSYLRSHEHQVLLGAISALCSGCTIQFRGLTTNVVQ